MVASQMSDQGEQQQQQQPLNHSSDNAETARCLTPFSHPEPQQTEWCSKPKHARKSNHVQMETRLKGKLRSKKKLSLNGRA